MRYLDDDEFNDFVTTVTLLVADEWAKAVGKKPDEQFVSDLDDHIDEFFKWWRPEAADCDGPECVAAKGAELREFPLEDGSVLALCRDCYDHEIAVREADNRLLAVEERVATPTWESLEVYDGD